MTLNVDESTRFVLVPASYPPNHMNGIAAGSGMIFSVANLKDPSMKTNHGAWYITTTAYLFIALVLNQPVSAQREPHQEGVFRIKVTESLAEQLQKVKFSKSLTGDIITGIQSMDSKNKQFKVKRFERVFRDAGFNEARHRKYGLHLWYEITIDKGNSVSDAMKSYRADKQIMKVEPVYKKAIKGSFGKHFGPRMLEEVHPSQVILLNGSNDPLLSSQWHYNNTGQTGGTAGADIRLFEAWKVETGKKNVIVAVTDGGVQTNHPDLAANMWVNEDEIPGNNIDDDKNGFVDDINGYSFVTESGEIGADHHGTHVAGTIAAVSNNGIGVAGIAGGSGSGDGVRIMSCAVFDSYSATGFPESYVYAADNGAVISQNSWGYVVPGIYEESVLAAIDYFIAEAGKDANGNQTGPMSGGIVIFAAGNDYSEDNYYPAYYEPVLAVAASTHKDLKANYSNYGSWVDISAPGGETFQSDEEGVVSTLANGEYGSFMGTSMACPHVSGIAALVVSRYGKSGFTPTVLRARLTHSVQNIDGLNPSYAGKLGAGRIHAGLAVVANDNTVPQAVRDLTIVSADVGQMNLTWTAPNDNTGFVSRYDVRRSTSPITSSNFSNATAIGDVPVPGAPGVKESLIVKNLMGGVVYYFAMRSIDFEGNISPISNVVSRKAELTPVITVNPTAINANLKTAQISPRTLTITNAGPGPLKFNVMQSTANGVFVDAVEGMLTPGSSQQIQVSLNAKRLPAGTYHTEIKIQSNDPQRDTVFVPVTLTVTNNNAPIASITPSDMDFINGQVGSSVRRPLTISNDGSHVLIIKDVTSTNAAFGADFPDGTQIRPFVDTVLYLAFSPTSTGLLTGEVSILTNDPAHPTFKVKVKGEGLTAAPIAASPSSFAEMVEKNKIVTRTLTLQNNGSTDRKFRIEVANSRAAALQPGQSATGFSQSQPDSSAVRRMHMIEKHKAALAKKGAVTKAMFTPLRTEVDGGTSTPKEILQYKTDFEEFNVGPVSGQHGWYSTQGWSISNGNADGGSQHFRGTSVTSGSSEKYAISPFVYYDEYNYPHYSSTSMRLNLDQGKGVAWQVVTQAEAFISNRILFNSDGTIDAMVIDNDYEFHWKRVPVKTPSGYFDLAIEYNTWGSDTSGFPTYHLFINNQHVLSGTGLGFGISQVAIVSAMETDGAIFDMDNLTIAGDEYIPYVAYPAIVNGLVPAGGSTNIPITFNSTPFKYGLYESELIVHLDEIDSLVIPASMRVIGEAQLYLEPAWGMGMVADKGEDATGMFALINTGGQPVQYRFDFDMPGLTIEPREGILGVRETINARVRFHGPPGMYEELVHFSTDIPNRPVDEIRMNIIVLDSGAVFSAPDLVELDVIAGEISAHTIQFRNKGINTVSYQARLPLYQEWVKVEPADGMISSDPVDVILTFDNRSASPGRRGAWINVYTNEPDIRYHRVEFILNVLPDTVRGGRVMHEVWKGITGRTVASIPVAKTPSVIQELTSFESPSNVGDNYGSRTRGYLLVPDYGYHTFWIASNDDSELWLSSDENPENKQKIASVTGYTNPLQWEKYPTQRSVQIYLQANKRYYIEALHKEGVGTDHMAVGWQLEDGTFERPIPGLRLAPYPMGENILPEISLTAPLEDQNFINPATIHIAANATDQNGRIIKVEFFGDSIWLGADTEAPYEFTWTGVQRGTHVVMVKATDNLGATASARRDLIVGEGQACADAGHISREQWNRISGTLVSSIPVHTTPTSTGIITRFETEQNIGDNYGARIRGYLCVPVTGEYRLWIASNDHSELWLSKDSSPNNKLKIAYVSGATNPRQWTKFRSQQSALIKLVAGTKYYIEALHKEGVGSDHLSVGWQLPDGTFERPIPGVRLLPFNGPGNEPPVVRITSPVNGDEFSAPATVRISVDASDSDGTLTRVEFYEDATKLGEDRQAPYSFEWRNVPPGSYSLSALAVDDQGGATASSPVGITIHAMCMASGAITREFWNNVPGAQVADIPVERLPDGTHALMLFEGPVNAGSNYAARISGYVCPPATGNYFFWIASNDHSELWLSTDDDPARKALIASVWGATGIREWSKFTSQKSKAIQLTQGKRYYIEALHKQGIGSDHIAVGWQLPDGTLERPIGGNRLSPLIKEANGVARLSAGGTGAAAHEMEDISQPAMHVYPNPVTERTLTIESRGRWLTDTKEIEIRKMTGYVVYSQRINCPDECKFEVILNNEFTPGLYILNVKGGDESFISKFMVD